MKRAGYTIQLKKGSLLLGERTIIMGILNITPDSFSDGGKFVKKDSALLQALKMVSDGADIIDIGGESTRPGAEAVTEEEEMERVIPVIEAIRKETEIPLSIDTYKSAVARAALDAGADIINDISGLRFDPKMAGLAAERNCPVAIMHIKGTPKDMQNDPKYNDVVSDIKSYLRESIDIAARAGLSRENIIIDPGIGFGKTTEHNLTIIRRLAEFSELDRPILIGVSKKSFIGHILGLPVEKRIFGTAAAVSASIMNGAHIIRVHDVAEMKQIAKIIDAIIPASDTEAIL